MDAPLPAADLHCDTAQLLGKGYDLAARHTRHHIDLPRSFLIGDRWRDIDAGHNAGCVTVLIDRGYREAPPARPPEARVPSLAAAIEWICRREDGGDAIT